MIYKSGSNNECTLGGIRGYMMTRTKWGEKHTTEDVGED